jgi:hypothetical protein
MLYGLFFKKKKLNKYILKCWTNIFVLKRERKKIAKRTLKMLEQLQFLL